MIKKPGKLFAGFIYSLHLRITNPVLQDQP